MQHITETVPAPSRANPEVPPWMDRIVATATAASPGERFRDASEMAAALRAGLGEAVPPVSPTVPPGTAPEDSTQAVPAPTTTSPLTVGLERASGGLAGIGERLARLPRAVVGAAILAILTVVLAFVLIGGPSEAPGPAQTPTKPVQSPAAVQTGIPQPLDDALRDLGEAVKP